MITKGYSIDAECLNEKLLNMVNEFGFDLRHSKEVNVLKDNIRHRNMTNMIKVKEKSSK